MKLWNEIVTNFYGIFSEKNKYNHDYNISKDGWKYEYYTVLKKIDNRGRLYSLLILKQQNQLKYSDEKSMKELADLFEIKCKDDKNIAAKVRKDMVNLFPIVCAEQVKDPKTKKWLYTSFEIKLSEPDGNYTQLPCDLMKIPKLKKDHLVIFVILNYYKSKHQNLDIYPSHETIAELAGCSERKVYTLLKEGQKLGLWKQKRVKCAKSNAYNISYIEDGIERYIFRDTLEKLERERLEIEAFINEEKAIN